MDTITRNNIFLENLDLINRTLSRHRLLLRAMKLEQDDVYQELAMAALQAIDSFDARRSDSVTVHIWAQLQYAILTIKRRHKPYGMTGFDRFGPGVWSLELAEEYGNPAMVDGYEEDLLRERRLRQALSRLEPQERQAVILYLEGVKPDRKAEKSDLSTAMEKLREFYTALQYAAGFTL